MITNIGETTYECETAWKSLQTVQRSGNVNTAVRKNVKNVVTRSSVKHV